MNSIYAAATFWYNGLRTKGCTISAVGCTKSMRLPGIIILLFISTSAQAQIVYKTPSGAKYHTAQCHTVKNTSTAITLKEASELGLQPCKICHPEARAGQQFYPGHNAGTGESVQCHGLTKAGARCKHMTKIANGYCFQHQPK